MNNIYFTSQCVRYARRKFTLNKYLLYVRKWAVPQACLKKSLYQKIIEKYVPIKRRFTWHELNIDNVHVVYKLQ